MGTTAERATARTGSHCTNWERHVVVATGMLTCSFRSAAPKNKGTKVKLGDFLADESE